MSDRYYTQEQQQALAQRRDALGPDGMRAAEQAWADLIAEAEAERAAGTDPAAPRMQDIARRWRALIEQFTDRDPGIGRSLGRMYRERASSGPRAAPSRASSWPTSAGAQGARGMSAPSTAPNAACPSTSCAKAFGLRASGGQAPERTSGWSRSSTPTAGHRRVFSASAARIP